MDFTVNVKKAGLKELERQSEFIKNSSHINLAKETFSQLRGLLLGMSNDQILKSNGNPWLFKPNKNQEKLHEPCSDYSYKVYVLKHKESLFS